MFARTRSTWVVLAVTTPRISFFALRLQSVLCAVLRVLETLLRLCFASQGIPRPLGAGGLGAGSKSSLVQVIQQFQVRVVVSALSSSKSPHQLRSLRKLKGAGAQATGLRPRLGA